MLFLQALLIGFCIAAPVGPIGVLCIQRSLTYGFGPGIATGMGAACADAVYGLLGALGIAGAVTAFPHATSAIQAGGGAFLIYLAWHIARDARQRRDGNERGAGQAAPAARSRAFLSTFALTLSNPMTILSFVAIFAALGANLAHGGAARLAPALMVAGVFAGSAAWWLILSGTAAWLRTRLSLDWMRRVSWFSATVVALLGALQCVLGCRHLLAPG
jgi:threonine/homoserine/homoserine lactone efflux protein